MSDTSQERKRPHLSCLVLCLLLSCSFLLLQHAFPLCCLSQLRPQAIQLTLQPPSSPQLPLQPGDLSLCHVKILLLLVLRCRRTALLLPQSAQLVLKVGCVPVLGFCLSLEVRNLLLRGQQVSTRPACTCLSILQPRNLSIELQDTTCA